jgi:hypothetical protein
MLLLLPTRLVYAGSLSDEQQLLGVMLWRMGDETDKIIPTDYVIESIKAEIESASPSRKRRIFEAIALAALGSIPWLGGVISAAASYSAVESEVQRQDLLREWLQEHHEKLQQLRLTLERMVVRLEGFGQEVEERITSEAYLTLVRKTFREWDVADTEEKRRFLVQLITNAGGHKDCFRRYREAVSGLDRFVSRGAFRSDPGNS